MQHLSEKAKEMAQSKFNYLEVDPWSGITKREYFAIQILAGMNANGMTTQEGVEPPYCMRKEDRCKYAVEQADCLLEALSKP